MQPTEHARPHLPEIEQASAWVQRWSHLVTPGQPVLDVACGQGRHLRWFAHRGHPVTGVDRSSSALATINLPTDICRTVLADIENGPWPLEAEQFAAVVVTHYLWRPLLPTLLRSVAPQGVLIYETFAVGQERLGKPSRPEFLLRPGELLNLCAGLQVVAFEEGMEPAEPGRSARFMQRIAAMHLEPNDPLDRSRAVLR